MLFAVLLLFVFGCVSKTAEKVETVPKDKRCKQSEMAALRLQMYPKSTGNKRGVLKVKCQKILQMNF